MAEGDGFAALRALAVIDNHEAKSSRGGGDCTDEQAGGVGSHIPTRTINRPHASRNELAAWVNVKGRVIDNPTSAISKRVPDTGPEGQRRRIEHLHQHYGVKYCTDVFVLIGVSAIPVDVVFANEDRL